MPLVATTTTAVSVPEEPPTTTTRVTLVPGGRAAEDIFVELNDELSYVTLDPGDEASLGRQFQADERLDIFLQSVSARGVQRDELVAVVVAVAVAPSAAAEPQFRSSFIDGATANALQPPEAVPIGTEEMLSFRDAEGNSSLLWLYENVFVLFVGEESRDVTTVATVIAEGLVGPFPVPTTTTEFVETTTTVA